MKDYKIQNCSNKRHNVKKDNKKNAYLNLNIGQLQIFYEVDIMAFE